MTNRIALRQLKVLENCDKADNEKGYSLVIDGVVVAVIEKHSIFEEISNAELGVKK